MFSRTQFLIQSASNAGPSVQGQKLPGKGYNRTFRFDIWAKQFYQNHFSEVFNHAVFGYTIRVAAVVGVCSFTFLTGRRLVYWSEEDLPVSKRKFQRWVPVTFIDKTREGMSDIWVYRFALPNSFDYTGHDCFSSCQINLFNRALDPTRRFYTPINHPEQRGIVEFGIKSYNPGELSNTLASFQPGETVWIGGWLKEFDYQPNQFDDVGFIAANSGITPFLQLLTCALANPEDRTKFSLLFCNDSVDQIPFRKKLEAVRDRFPDRFRLTHMVTKGADAEPVKLPRASAALEKLGVPLSSTRMDPATSATAALFKGQLDNNIMTYDDSLREIVAEGHKSRRADYKDVFQGFVDRNMILETMPWPKQERSKVFVCGPAQMLGNVCGRSVSIYRSTYVQGIFDGIMSQMGYSRSQVYKFGYTFHPLGYDE